MKLNTLEYIALPVSGLKANIRVWISPCKPTILVCGEVVPLNKSGLDQSILPIFTCEYNWVKAKFEVKVYSKILLDKFSTFVITNSLVSVVSSIKIGKTNVPFLLTLNSEPLVVVWLKIWIHDILIYGSI